MSDPADLRSDETKFWHGEIARAAAAERERCARIAETIKVECNGHPQIDAPTPADYMRAIAAAIRGKDDPPMSGREKSTL